jgi:hypothetical protein
MDVSKELVLDHLFDDSTGLPLLHVGHIDVHVLGAASEASPEGVVSTCDEFLGALKASENVASVTVSLDLRDRPCGLEMIQTAFTRPNLQELHLFDDAAKPAHFAEIVLPLASKQLRVLSLSHVDLPSQKDVLQLALVVGCLPGLTAIRIHDMVIGGEGGVGSAALDESSMVQNNLSLDPLLDSLSILRQVESLELSCDPRQTEQGNQFRRLVSDASLTRLFQRLDRLSDISLWSLGIDAHHVNSIKHVLRAHPTLSFLSLRRNEIDWTTFGRDVLTWNMNLCHVYGDFSEHVECQIEVWLLLNRLGRGRALTSAMGERSWLDLFDVVREDYSLVFALLISDPMRIGSCKK